MANKPYNGFSATQRTRGGKWYRQRKMFGVIVVADTCCCCSSPIKVAGHSEDYSEPFGAHIGAFDLCWICHMMIHCRARNPKRWAQYIDELESGLYFAYRELSWQRFTVLFLGKDLPTAGGIQTEIPRVLIRDISMGLYNPNDGGFQYWHPSAKALHQVAGDQPGMLL